MKHKFTILFILFITCIRLEAQDSVKLKQFREGVLPHYYFCFSKAELTEKGLLKLTALEKYSGYDITEKKSIMTGIATTWLEPLILVNSGTMTELWSWNSETGNAELLDKWDLNPAQRKEMPVASGVLPWFFYVGDEFDIGQNTFNIGLNLRLGCYMLANRLDLALTFSWLNSNFTGSTTSSNSFSYGLLGRVRFPIKNSKLCPSLGGQLAITSSDGSTTTTPSLVLGISWFVGIGSIDIDFDIGNEFTGAGGCTIAPNMVKQVAH